jgi:hypothetical protein
MSTTPLTNPCGQADDEVMSSKNNSFMHIYGLVLHGGESIIKQSNRESFFDEYSKDVALFQGKMNQCASSIEIVLDDIFEKSGIRPPKMLGCKISKLRESRSYFSAYSGNFDDLLKKLEKFNSNWVISKHGMVVGGENIKNITLFKDGSFHVFDKKKIEEIQHEFTQIQTVLIEIHKSRT